MGSSASEFRVLDLSPRAIRVSIILHVAVPFFFGTAHLLDKIGIHLLPKSDKKKEVVQEFIQVDIVGLPNKSYENIDLSKSQLPLVDNPKPEAKAVEPEKMKEEEMALPSAKEVAADKKKKEREKEKENEKKRLAEQAKALKKLEQEAKKEQALKALAKNRGKQEGRQKMAGNKVSQGTASSGAIGEAKNRYAGLITQAIREKVSIYPNQKNKGLVALVYIEILPSGKLKEKRLTKPSADPLFNTAVMQAVSSAFFPVPEDPNIVKGEGFTIEFTPEEQ